MPFFRNLTYKVAPGPTSLLLAPIVHGVDFPPFVGARDRPFISPSPFRNASPSGRTFFFPSRAATLQSLFRSNSRSLFKVGLLLPLSCTPLFLRIRRTIPLSIFLEISSLSSSVRYKGFRASSKSNPPRPLLYAWYSFFPAVIDAPPEGRASTLRHPQSLSISARRPLFRRCPLDLAQEEAWLEHVFPLHFSNRSFSWSANLFVVDLLSDAFEPLHVPAGHFPRFPNSSPSTRPFFSLLFSPVLTSP